MHEDICVVAMTFDQAADFVTWLNRHVEAIKIDRSQCRIDTKYATYKIITLKTFTDPDRLLGYNFSECYVLDRSFISGLSVFYETMHVIDRRRAHMKIPTENFYKYFDGYFGR